MLPAIMDISARAISLADRPLLLGHLGHQCSHAPGRPNLLSSHPLADAGEVFSSGRDFAAWLGGPCETVGQGRVLDGA
jgi:hypothetical protein